MKHNAWGGPPPSELLVREDTKDSKAKQAIVITVDCLPEVMVRPYYWRHHRLWSQDAENLKLWWKLPPLASPYSARRCYVSYREKTVINSLIQLQTLHATSLTKQARQIWRCKGSKSVMEGNKGFLIRFEVCPTGGNHIQYCQFGQKPKAEKCHRS